MCNITEVLERYIATDDTSNKLLGVAAIVVNETGVLHSGAAGKIDFRLDASPFTVDTFGWIASMTKLITTVAAMQLVEKGIIDLDQDLRPLVPELNTLEIIRGFHEDGTPNVDKNIVAVTLRHLLSHTSGMTYGLLPGHQDLARYNEHIGRTDTALSYTKEGFLEALTFAPGEGWSYGAGVDWAGQLIERISGQALNVYLQEQIFVPLGMKTTVFFPEVPPSAIGHETAFPIRLEDGSLTSMARPTPSTPEFTSGGAGLCSTASDYALFLRAFLAGELVTESTMNEMFTSSTPNADQGRSIRERLMSWAPGFGSQYASGTALDHGLGGIVTLEDMPGKRRAGSMSWGGASNPQWWVDRKSGLACVMFVNQWPWGDHVVGQLWDDLERAVYGALGR